MASDAEAGRINPMPPSSDAPQGGSAGSGGGGMEAGREDVVHGGAAGTNNKEMDAFPETTGLYADGPDFDGTDGECLSLPDLGVVGGCEKTKCCDDVLACLQDPSCKACVENASSLCEGSEHWKRLQACRKDQECLPALTLAIVHASANLPPFRVCLQVEAEKKWLDSLPLPSDPAAVMPHTNEVGVPPGGGLVVQHIESLVGTSSTNVIPYLIELDPLKTSSYANKKCETLLDHCVGSCLKDNQYHKLPAVALGTGASGTSVSVLVVHGCDPKGTGPINPTRCGSEGTTAMDLAVTALPVFTLGWTNPVQGIVRIRPANLSVSAEAVLLAEAGANAALTMVYGEFGASGAQQVLLEGAKFPPSSEIPPSEIDVPGLSSTDLPLFANRGFTLIASGASSSETPLQLSLASVQDVSDNKNLPHTFWNGSSDFLLALVGDATGASTPLVVEGGLNPLFDGYGLHILALPLRSRESQKPTTPQ